MRLNTPAFPSGPGETWSDGMTLRDYFAIRVLQAIHPENVAMNAEQQKQSAEYCYTMATAMLVARED